jgi:aspartyl protease family protein
MNDQMLMCAYFSRVSGRNEWLRKRRLVVAWAALALLFCLPAVAATRVNVVALFDGKAMLEIDGRRQFMTAGQTTPEGVRLLAASTKEAVLEVDGRRQTLSLSRRVGGSYVAPSERQVHISRNGRGMFTTAGAINGAPMSFLVDTGASSIALNASDAARAGIDYRLHGTRVAVSTASGATTGYQVTLRQVSVGDISLPNVQAVVLEGASPTMPLLGMSFLGRLKMRHEGTLLVLEQLH